MGMDRDERNCPARSVFELREKGKDKRQVSWMLASSREGSGRTRRPNPSEWTDRQETRGAGKADSDQEKEQKYQGVGRFLS